MNIGDVSQDDIREIRRQGELKDWFRMVRESALEERERVRKLVMRHPDLVARLGEPPMGLRVPSLWTGFVPPLEWNGSPNSLMHRAYQAVVDEAERRERRTT